MISKQQQKYVQSLHNKKYRQEYGEFIVEGEKNILELIKSDFEVVNIFCGQELEEVIQKISPIIPIVSATEEQINAISTQKNQNKGVAIVKMRHTKNEPVTTGITLVLDGINDPGNLGTIIRLADWYGLQNIICSEDTVEFYNPKVISSTMGSFCRISCFYTNLQTFLKSTNLPVFGAFLNGENLHKADLRIPSIIVIGSESHGIRENLKDQIKHKITIPGFGKAESLNAGVATGIILDNFISRSSQ